MSAVASFFRFYDANLVALRQSVRSYRLGAASRADFAQFLRVHGEHLSDFPVSGSIFGTVLACLKEEHHIDLMKSGYDDLRDLLSTTLGAVCFFLTAEHRATYLPNLEKAVFDGARLNAYYNAFNGTRETRAGHAMVAAIEALTVALFAVNAGSLVLVHIG